MLLIFVGIFLYILTLLSRYGTNVVRIWCSWCSIADFSSACTGSSPVIRCLNVYSLIGCKMFKQIILWLLIMAIGMLFMYFSGQITEFIGRSVWADEHLGGTKNAVVLFGVIVFILWWLVLLGVVWFTNPTDLLSTGFE